VIETGNKNQETGVRDYTNLKAWQTGHQLVISVYRLTKMFPKEELYGLINQMRRAIVSVTSNIAEGFSRYSRKEKLRFYGIARASLVEFENQLYIARDIGYLDAHNFDDVHHQVRLELRMLNGLMQSQQ
jgi:four helix bundle protein